MASSEMFHMENNVIITSKCEISVQNVFNYLSKILDKFRVGSHFIVVCGVHGSKAGELKKYDEDFKYDYEMMFRWFKNHKKYGTQAKIVDERQYYIGTVLELNSVEHENDEGKFLLTEGSKAAIKNEFERILLLNKPIVLILASCWSFGGEISNILRTSGLYSALNLSEERGIITSGKLFQLDKEQQDLLRIVTNNPMIKDVIIFGHYGSGKTMLAVEVAKIKLARFLEEKEDVKVNVLTYDTAWSDYTLLIEEFKSKYFQDLDKSVDKSIIRIGSVSNFVKDVLNDQGEHEYDLTWSDMIFSPVVADILKKIDQKIIILIDEFDIDEICQNFQLELKKDGAKLLKVDFLPFVQLENVHFVICIRPRSYRSLDDFELICSLDQRFQMYKNLLVRHRNAKKILEFLRFWQKFGSSGINLDMSAFPNIKREEILDEQNLPPLLENQEHGVIWISIHIPIPSMTEKDKHSIANTIKKIFENSTDGLLVAVLYHRIGYSKIVAEKVKNIGQNYHGPYEENHFNGKEADIIIYVTSSVKGLYIQSLARARRLLILLTHDSFGGEFIMNEAVKKSLVKKICIN